MLGSRAHTRFGLGARPSDAPLGVDPRGFLLAQLEGDAPARPVPEGADDRTVADAFRTFRTALGAGRAGEEEREAARRAARRTLVQVVAAESTSALSIRLTTARPFVERLVAFWSDHLCVSLAGKFAVGPFAGRYERDVIRPHVLGRFDEMVLASARHPAMLFYLDNAQSIGPGSRAVSRLARLQRARPDLAPNAPRGLNENYARELLELHTLGVDGGYTQQDVTELARLLTGWSITPLQLPGVPQFDFAENRHEPGAKTVVGARYGEGEAEGVRAIRALCRHPSTARHIAGKLARHFVSDDPPTAVVDRLAATFARSEGDLREMARALVREDACWDVDHRKFRPPQDWLIAAFRHFDLTQMPVQGVASLRQLRQPLWAPPSPKGFGDLVRDWADPDALLNRAELARTIARRVAPRRGDDAAIEIAGPDFQWR
jgi:uncharacterized protein (DUF1800 family)